MKDSEGRQCGTSQDGTSPGQEMKGKQNMRRKIVGIGLLAERENLMKDEREKDEYGEFAMHEDGAREDQIISGEERGNRNRCIRGKDANQLGSQSGKSGRSGTVANQVGL
jgi:hypothetical protein